MQDLLKKVPGCLQHQRVNLIHIWCLAAEELLDHLSDLCQRMGEPPQRTCWLVSEAPVLNTA